MNFIHICIGYGHFTDPCETRLTRKFKWFREATRDFELSAHGRFVHWNGDLCVCHRIWVSSTCIGAKSVAISRKLACFRENFTAFELSVLGHFTDSTETRLGVKQMCSHNIVKTIVKIWGPRFVSAPAWPVLNKNNTRAAMSSTHYRR